MNSWIIQRKFIDAGNFIRGAYELQETDLLFRVESRFAITSAVTETPIDLPACYDVSHWITPITWEALSPKPLFMFTKATESTNYKDPTFPEYFTKMRDIVGCLRGAYHFFRKSTNPVQQANWFVDYITPYINDNDVLVLDFEEGGETASQLWAFLDQVRKRCPNNLLMIYSRKNLFDPIVMTESEKTFFKAIPTWPAGYSTTPAPSYDTIPAQYIPDQTKWGESWCWQYTTSGHPAGTVSDIDCNVMTAKFIEWVNSKLGTPVDPPPTGETMQGLVLETGSTIDINIRTAPTSTAPDVGDLFAGDVIDYDRKQYVTTGSFLGDWYHITKVTRVGGSILTPGLVDWWCWGKNIKELVVTPPPPPTTHTVDVYIDDVLVSHTELD